MNAKKYAASIDIGTNTARFLVGEIMGQIDFKHARSGGAITRLGKGLKQTGRLSRERIDYTASVLSGFKEDIAPFRPEFVSAVATSAVREAANGPEFVAEIKKKTGIEVEVIDWTQEAERMLMGAFWGSGTNHGSGTNQNIKSLIFDIGGGSTEFIACKGPRLLESWGTNLGVVHLAEEFLKSDPLSDADLAALKEGINKELMKIGEKITARSPRRMVCTAGPPTTLVAIHLKLDPYDPERVHNFRLSRERIQEIFDFLRGMPLSKRKQLPWLEEGRADVILPGAQIILQAMELFGFEDITVSDHGLREGALLYELAKQ